MLGKKFNKEILKGLLFSNANILIEGIFGIILYPILLHKFDVEIAGLWIFFLSFYPIVNLAQAGIGTVVSRVANKNTRLDVSIDFLMQLRLIYYAIVLAMGLICFVLYFNYIKIRVSLLNVESQGTWAWILISLSFCVKMYFNRNFHLLNSFGIVGRDKLSTSITTLINLTGISLVIYLDLNIAYLGLVYFFSSIFYGRVSMVMINQINPQEKFNSNGKISAKKIFEMCFEGGKILILNLTAFVVLQLGLFISEKYFGLQTFTYYSALVKMSALVIAISTSISSILFPYIALSFNKRNKGMVIRRYKQNINLSITVGVVLYFILLISAEFIIPLWLGKEGYLGINVLLPICLLGLIYITHTAHANSIIATGTNTFLIPAITNSIFSSLLMVLGAKFFGLEGMIYGGIIGCIPSSIYVIIWSKKFMKNLIDDH